MNYDIIVIGGGLGGLSAGAKLAKEGRKVLLLEQHDRPGGYATTFQRGEFTLEVGLHEADGPGPKDMKTRIYKELGVFEQLEFLPLPEFYRFVNGRVEVCIPHDPAEAAARLKLMFPEEEAGIQAYFDHLLLPARPEDKDKPDRSLGDFLDSIITNPDLKLILLGNLGYFHDDPYSLSLAYYTIAQSSYYKNAASFIKGGSQQLSSHLASFIEQNGGSVLLNTKALALLCQNGKISAVTYQSGKKPDSPRLQAAAPVIVLGSPLPGLRQLLPESYRPGLESLLNTNKPGASLLSLYLGFDRPLKELGCRHYSTFVYDHSVASPRDILKNNHAGFDSRSFTFVDYSQVDSGLAPAGKSVGALCCIDYLSDWELPDRKAYLQKKQEVKAVLMERLEKWMPGIKEHIVYSELGTPYTLKRYTSNPEGAVYGFAQLPGRQQPDLSFLPSNLYIASAWGKTGGGFSGAILGGYLSALTVLRNKT